MEKHFSLLGEITDCVLMMDRGTGRSRCFGFVTFKEQSSFEAALSAEQVVDGKKVDCKLAVPSSQLSPQASPSAFRTKKLFVGGLPSGVTEEAFRGYFESFGAIEDSIIMYDRETGRPRGFGFITFLDEAVVENVLLNYDHNFINGKWVECKKATPKQLEGISNIQNYVNPIMQYYMAPPFYPTEFKEFIPSSLKQEDSNPQEEEETS